MKELKVSMLIKKYQRLIELEPNELKRNIYQAVLEDLMSLLENKVAPK
ncbi:MULTISPECIES: hypothetical protein [Olivibacter]|jgi:DNA-directed RNA polymerase subunit E'/Rpb7|uniref:Uncharacterized protein n=3 Tax=Sphingobacteriaceae TaxID=84566 RepID=A0ABV6HEL1_9SPHI|nr:MULTISPECIES: hypothetical protein [Olivibacter]MCL4641027.1 hypothetical protein [Olivibacter sp. UJ_SKK_5.1]MDM8177882.1 hypothetical protein [Olivibacter sp. 47]MDX3916212.1 hypothetical protein [Pseudosphingobacterium sp.]